MGSKQFGKEIDQQSSSSSHQQKRRHRRRTMKDKEKHAVESNNNNELIFVDEGNGIQQNPKLQQEPEQLYEAAFESGSTLMDFKNPKGQSSIGTDKSESSKNCRKCKKLREKAAKSQKSKKAVKQYENLSTEEEAAMENSKVSTSTTLEAESACKRRRRRSSTTTSTTSTSKTEKESKSQKKQKNKKYEGTQPVYMPRSKYYRDNNTDDEKTSKPEHSRRSRKRRTSSSSTRKQQRNNGKNQRRRHYANSSSSSLNVTKLNDDDNMFYIGSYTATEAAKILKPNEFRIYYQVPENPKSIPYKLRLYLSYMSSQKKEVFHFPVVCGKNSRSGENFWSLRYTDSATFPTLLALIKYHKTYAYMDPKTGKIDTFPVWKGAIIDDDSLNES